MAQQTQDFEMQLDGAYPKFGEIDQNPFEKIEENKKEITNKNDKLQNKDVEIQNLKLDHKKEIMETLNKGCFAANFLTF